MKRTVYIREVLDYEIEVEVSEDAEAVYVARAARAKFLANTESASIMGVDERSFEVASPSDSLVAETYGPFNDDECVPEERP